MTARRRPSPLLATVGLQWVTVLVAGLLTALWSVHNALWVLVGGAAVAGPNAALAAYLWLRLNHLRVLSIATFLAGEGLKLLGTVLVLLVAVTSSREPVPLLAVLAGVVVALKGQWLAVWFTRHH